MGMDWLSPNGEMIDCEHQIVRAWTPSRGKLVVHVLETLMRERLYAKFSKCEFWLHEVQFLGHIVNHNDILVDPAKVKAVMR